MVQERRDPVFGQSSGLDGGYTSPLCHHVGKQTIFARLMYLPNRGKGTPNSLGASDLPKIKQGQRGLCWLPVSPAGVESALLQGS